MATLELEDVSAASGSVVEGLSLDGELDDDTCRLLRQTFDERGVLVFRDAEFTPEDQKYLAGVLTTTTPPRREAMENAAQLYPTNVSNRDEGGNAPYGSLLYHSDMMWAEAPMQLLSLYALEVEQPSVPTVFASATHAWETLPEDLRARVDGLSALHITGQQERGEARGELLKSVRENDQYTIKPIAYPHPRTGRIILYVCQMMTREIVGLEYDESEELLEALFAHLYGAENTWEHHWRNGDLVLWDNLAVQHARPSVSLEGPARTLRKVIAPPPAFTNTQAETPRFLREAG